MSNFPVPWYCEEWDCAVDGHDWDDDDVCTQCGAKAEEKEAADSYASVHAL